MTKIEEDLMVRIAWLHYQEGITLSEIAERFGLSRPKVTRLLDKARRSKIVRFLIEAPNAHLLSLEEELKRVFLLEDAVVVPSSEERDVAYENVGKGGAIYLYRVLRKGDLVGVGWGSTLRYMADNLIPKEEVYDVRFVSLAGGLTVGSFMNPYNIGERLASVYRGECYYIHAPNVVESPELREFYLAERVNRKTFEMAKNARLSFLGIGVVHPQFSTYIKTGFIDTQDMEIIRRMGGVGDIFGQFYDIEGNMLDLEIHRRTIAVSPLELRNMPNVIGLAGGVRKVEAILGAIRGRFIKILITDELTALKLLEVA
jgi:lsr operon transcriptional repressor